MEGAKWRNKAVPINKKRVTTLETSEVEGSQGESFCSIDEIPVSNSIKDESYFSEPLVTNGVETYMCIVCGEPLFLANKRLGMYDLVSLTFTKPIRSARKNISLMTSFSTSLYSQAEKRPGHVKFQCSNVSFSFATFVILTKLHHQLGEFSFKSGVAVKFFIAFSFQRS